VSITQTRPAPCNIQAQVSKAPRLHLRFGSPFLISRGGFVPSTTQDINMPKARLIPKSVYRFIALTGNVIAAFGCIGLILGVLGVFDMEIFSFGLSSGIRIIGTVAIAGCLLSAIGYGFYDYVND